MVKPMRLTWGFSLCKLSAPNSFPEGINEVISYAGGSRKFASFRSKRRHVRLVSNLSQNKILANTDINDIELALLITPPTLVSNCSQKKRILLKSATGTRIFVYLVSLALSLAALSILKLHELLEWLLLESNTSWSGNVADIQNKSAVIAEILKETARRYSNSLQTVNAVNNAVPLNVYGQSSENLPTNISHASIQAGGSSQLESPSPRSVAGKEHSCEGGCFHFQQSPNCLLCHLACSEECSFKPLFSDPLPCQSVSKPAYGWSPPSRLNAGICRTQVSLDASPGVISVELCSREQCRLSGLQIAAALGKSEAKVHYLPQSQFIRPDTTGVSLSLPVERSTKLAKVSIQVASSSSPSTTEIDTAHDRIASSQTHSTCVPRQVACVAPTTKRVFNLCDTPYPVGSDCRSLTSCPVCRSQIKIPRNVFPLMVVEETEANDSLISSADVLSLVQNDQKSFLLSANSATILARLAVSLSKQKVFRDQATELSKQYSDSGTSPIPDFVLRKLLTDPSHTNPEEELERIEDLSLSLADDKSDAEGLELDDDGVWLNSDFVFSLDNSCFSIMSDSEYLTESDAVPPTSFSKCNSREKFNVANEVADAPESIATGNVDDACLKGGITFDSGHFSGLTELTSSISQDLQLLETGYHELIYRVQANRIELDNVQEHLGYVWCTKDILAQSNSDNEAPTSVGESSADFSDTLESRFVMGSSMMQSSCHDGSFLSSPRPAPLGQSFYPDATSDVACCCNCHDSTLKKITSNPFSHFSETNFQDRLTVNDIVPRNTLCDFSSPDSEPISSFDISLSSLLKTNFVYTDLSFEDDDAIQWSNSKSRTSLQ